MAHSLRIFKQTASGPLHLHGFMPQGDPPDTGRAAIVFFFGGGFVKGSPQQFYPHCRYLASLGMAAFAAEYRLLAQGADELADCVADAKSAVRWLRQNAALLAIDPDRIVAGGGSAGGHLALCTALVDGYDATGEDQTIPSVPNGLVLFNPALGFRPDRFAIDPANHVRPQAPPALVLHGEEDALIAVDKVQTFCHAMTEVGNSCELIRYPGMGHGFFNWGRDENRPFVETVWAMDRFLVRSGFLTHWPPRTQEEIEGRSHALPIGESASSSVG